MGKDANHRGVLVASTFCIFKAFQKSQDLKESYGFSSGGPCFLKKIETRE